MKLAGLIKSLLTNEVADTEHGDSAVEIADAISFLLSEVVLADDNECEKLEEIEQAIRDTACKVAGDHSWLHDQCGYWGHQYCVRCNTHKYPELGVLSCKEAAAKAGTGNEGHYVLATGINLARESEASQ